MPLSVAACANAADNHRNAISTNSCAPLQLESLEWRHTNDLIGSWKHISLKRSGLMNKAIVSALVSAMLAISAYSSDVSAAQCEFKNLKSLGWGEGNKHKFCVKRGYSSVTNMDYGGASVKKFGGGWCWKGPSDAVCHAELNAQDACAEYEPQTNRCLKLIFS